MRNRGLEEVNNLYSALWSQFNKHPNLGILILSIGFAGWTEGVDRNIIISIKWQQKTSIGTDTFEINEAWNEKCWEVGIEGLVKMTVENMIRRQEAISRAANNSPASSSKQSPC